MLDAWDGVFTDGQWNDIVQLSLYADQKGAKLHDLVRARMAVNDTKKDNKSFIGKPVCPRCGKKMNISKISEVSSKYEKGYRTYLLCGAACCSGKGCGYEEFSKKTIKELIQQGG